MNILTRDMVKQERRFKRELVDVSELGPEGTETFVYVTEVSAAVKDEIEHEAVRYNKRNGRATVDVEIVNKTRARIAARCCVDESGARVFTDNDVDMLSERSSAALSRIFNAYKRLNEMSDEDEEELVKNSPTEP